MIKDSAHRQLKTALCQMFAMLVLMMLFGYLQWFVFYLYSFVCIFIELGIITKIVFRK